MRAREGCSRIKELLISGIVLCLLITGESNADSCNLGCAQSDSGIFKYAPGSVYKYELDSIIRIGLGEHKGDQVAVAVSGEANVYAEDNCVYTLQLNKITAEHNKFVKEISQDINKPVKFTLSSGTLHPEICADASDSEASLNIKRGVISLLQSSNENHETDVFGVCPTITSVSKSDSAEIITKVRNLNSCGYREQISNGLVYGVVNDRAGVKSSGALNGDYSKEIKLVHGIPQQIKLNEHYKTSPAASGANAVLAKIETELKLKKVDNGGAPQGPSKPASIIYKRTTGPSVKNIGALKKVFTNTVNLVNEYVQGDAAQYFADLIRLMRSSDTETLIELSVVPHSNKVLARKVYLDALFRVGTSNSVKAIIKQMSKMSETEKKLAFLSFNLVESVEKDALNQAAALLNGNAPKEAYLAVGNLVNKYCKSNICDVNELGAVSKKFTDALKHCKASDKKGENRIIHVLKGIRNTHKIAPAAAQALAECASAEQSARLRVAAIQAFTAAACTAELQSKALNILRDHNEDSEIRIEAYLAAIACPNAQLANDIADIVNNEPVYQVGGFITSSLKAIKYSTDPSREAHRHYLGNVHVTKKFPIDPRRYSFNGDLSYAIDSLGIGASADYSLIYSQKGYLPRSLRLNLTSEIYGTNFNVLEISARQENLEELINNFFGPHGFLETEGRKTVENLVTKVRPKRNIADDTEKLSKKYKTYGTKSNSDISLDLAIRIFGSELVFLSLSDNVPENVDDILNKLNEANNNVKAHFKKFDHEYTWHSLFYDAGHVYPTAIGLPLELIGQASSAINIGFATEIDLDAIAENPTKAKLRVKFVPSVQVSVTGHLKIDALVLTAGLRTVTNLHSAVGEDQTLEIINEGYGFNLNIQVPREQLELFSFKHHAEFVFTEPDKEPTSKLLKPEAKRAAPQEICFDQLQYVGMTLCFNSDLPEKSSENLLNSVLEPINFALKLQTEKNINLIGTYTKEPGSHHWKLKYSTPGSKVSHDSEFSLDVEFNTKIYIRGSIIHPELRLIAEAGIHDDEKELSLYGQYDVGGELTVQKIGFTKNGNEYRPLIEYKKNSEVSNDINGYKADGRVVKQGDGPHVRYVYENFQISKEGGDRIVVNGWVDVDPFRTELQIQHDSEVYEIVSHLSLKNAYSAGFFIRNQKWPIANGASVSLSISEETVKDSLVIAIANYRFELNNHFDLDWNDKHELNGCKFKNELKFEPGKAVALHCIVNGEFSPKTLQIQATGESYSKKASLDVNIANDERSKGDYNIDINAKVNEHFVDLKARGVAKGGHLVVDNSLTTSSGLQVTAKGEVGQRYTPEDIYINLEGSFILSSNDKQSNWLLKVIGTPDKTNTDFKLNRENADLVVLTAETTHPQDKIATGKVNLQVKDLLGAKADFKINKGGKGDLTALINLKKAQRKLTLDSKFVIASPKYDIETTIGYDTDKKLYFKTENVVDKNKLSTKSVVDVAGDKILLDVEGFTKGEWRLNGEVDGKASITIPNGRKISGQFNRKMTTAKNGITQGGVTASLVDQTPNNEQRSVELNAKLDKLNSKTNEVQGNIQFSFTNFNGKKLLITEKIKHTSKGNNKRLEVTIQSHGDLLNSPSDVNILLDEYSKDHAIFTVSLRNGEHFNANANGNYYIGERGQPTSYDIQINLATPQEKVKSHNFKSTGKFLSPEIEGGVYALEFHVSDQADSDSHKLNIISKTAKNHGSYSLDLSTTNLPNPIKIDGTYNHESESETSGVKKYTFNYSNGDQFLKSTIDIDYNEGKSGRLHYTVASSLNNLQNADLVIENTKGDDVINTNSKLQLNNQLYALDGAIHTAKHKKGIVIKLALPEVTTSVSTIVEILGKRKGKVNVIIENLGSLNLEHSGEASLQDINDFYIVSHTNSEKLNIDHVDVDIRAQDASGAENIQVNVKNAKGVILAGSLTYNVKNEPNKVIVEGQGQIQYYQKTNNANFKLFYQLFDAETDQEIGFLYTFNGNFGPKNTVSTLKITNKNFHAKISVCEEKKQCTNFEIRSVVTVDPKDVTSSQHDLVVLIDLRELGYPHEFELQAKSNTKGFRVHHEIESSIISNHNNKYHLSASIAPQANKIQVKLPSREIYLETEQVIPQGLIGHYQNSATFYFDRKNKPNDVTKIFANADITGSRKTSINAKGEFRVEHPTIRPLSVSGLLDASSKPRVIHAELVFDVFKTPSQKIVVSNWIKDIAQGQGFNITVENAIASEGLGINYHANGHTALLIDQQEFSAGYNIETGVGDAIFSGLATANKNRVELALHGMKEQLLNVLAELNRNKNSGKVTATMKLLTLKPLNLVAEVDGNSAKVSLKRPGLFDSSAEVKLGKEAKFVLKDENKKLMSGRIALDAGHFLATSIDTNEEDIQEFLKTLEKNIGDDTKVAKEHIQKKFQKIKETLDHQKELAKNSAPDLTALKANLEENAKDIIKDLESDPAIKKIIDSYRKYWEILARIHVDVAHTIGNAVEKIHASVNELYAKAQEVIKTSVLPVWEDFAKKLTVLLGELQVETVKLLNDGIQQGMKILKSLENDLKALGKPVYEVLKPLAESVKELTKTVLKDYEDFMHNLKEYLSKLPSPESVYEQFKDKLNNVKAADDILSYLRYIIDHLETISPSQETRDLSKKVYDYIEAKLRNKEINDLDILEDIYNALINFINSSWKRWVDLKPSTTNELVALPNSLNIINTLPIWLSTRFSVVNYLLGERIDPSDTWSALIKPPFEFLPPFNLVGHLTDGKTVFTFDGREYLFQGSCKYVLVQDADKNTFSVVATVKDGKLKSVTLIDDKSFAEVSDNGVLKVNGKPSEYPLHVGRLHAWRRYYTVNLLSEAGVHLSCTTDLKVCHVFVSGFLTSKTRGLFGNGNAEPYDDYTTIDGKIAGNHAELVNSYALGSCAPIAYVDNSNIQHDPICTELFSLTSDLAFGYLFIDPRPYRQACDEAVAAGGENKEEVACNIALTYASAVKKETLPIEVPKRCLKCVGAAGQREIGDEFTVKIPTNKADIVFVVDFNSTDSILENLVTPALSEIRNQLKTRGITDTQIAVIAYHNDQKYPALLTNNGGKLNYNGKISKSLLMGPKHSEPIDFGVSYIAKFIEMIDTILVPQADALAFKQALYYPFRAGAAKSIISVSTNHSLNIRSIFQLIADLITDPWTDINEVTFHTVIPVDELSIEGIPAEKIIGFNSRLVATAEGKDAKKRQKLSFEEDIGTEIILENKGWVFAAQNFDANGAEGQKTYLNQFANTIADNLFKTEITSECECTASYGLHGEHKCNIKSSNFVANKRPKAA